MPRLWPIRKRRVLGESTTAQADSATSQETPPAVQRPSPGTRQLWGREFAIVENGLAESQVVDYVERLNADNQASLQELEDAASWDTFSRRVLAEAEQEAARVKARARQEAEGEAARIISEAKRSSRELMDNANTRAEEVTEKAVQDILTTAQKKARLTENRARQLSQLMLIRSREEAQGAVTEEVHGTYHRLLSALEDMLSAARAIEGDWKSKTLELWGGASLALEGEEPVGLLGTPQLREFSPESFVVGQEMETPEATSQEELGSSITQAFPGIEAKKPTPVPGPAEERPSARANESLEAKPSTREPSRKAASTAEPQEQPEAEATLEGRGRPRSSPEKSPRPGKSPGFASSPSPAASLDENMEESPGRPSAWVGQPSRESQGPAELLLDSQEAADEWKPTLTSPTATLPQGGELEDGEGDLGPLLAQGAPASAEAADELEEAVASEAEERSADTTDVAKTASLAEGWQQAREAEESDRGSRQGRDWYAGEVDLVLRPPVDFAQVSRLYGHLQNLPEIRVLHTAGSWDQGTVVTIRLDKPGPLLSQLAAIPFLKTTPDPTPEGGGLLRTAMGTLGERSRRRQRIGIGFVDIPQDAEAAEQPSDPETSEERAKEEE